MCMTKDSGGLGFRDIKGFNIALLSKQCWKLMNEPNSLMARMLKAKYYPNSHFYKLTERGELAIHGLVSGKPKRK